MINLDDKRISDIEDDEDDEDDLIAQAAGTAAIAAGLSVIAYVEAYFDKELYHDSALSGESDDPLVSGSRKKQRATAIALDGVKNGLDMVASSIRELATARQTRRSHEHGGTTNGDRAESLQRRHEAMQRVQQIEKHLDSARLIALSDFVATDTAAADIYLSIDKEENRHTWIAMRLKRMGFVDGISI